MTMTVATVAMTTMTTLWKSIKNIPIPITFVIIVFTSRGYRHRS